MTARRPMQREKDQRLGADEPVVIRAAAPRIVVRSRTVLDNGGQPLMEHQVWRGRLIHSTHDFRDRALAAARELAQEPA